MVAVIALSICYDQVLAIWDSRAKDILTTSVTVNIKVRMGLKIPWFQGTGVKVRVMFT